MCPSWVTNGKLVHGLRMGNTNGAHLGLPNGLDMGKHNQSQYINMVYFGLVASVRGGGLRFFF